jgi:hypothetical protein
VLKLLAAVDSASLIDAQNWMEFTKLDATVASCHYLLLLDLNHPSKIHLLAGSR